MVSRSWNSFYVGRNFSQYLQIWVVLFCVVFFSFFPVCLSFLYFNTLGLLACFGFSLNTFSCRLFSISSSRCLLHFKQTQIHDLQVPHLGNFLVWNFWKEYPESTTAGTKILQPCHLSGQITPSYAHEYWKYEGGEKKVFLSFACVTAAPGTG